MSALIVFGDTETTSLRHDRRAWEVGLFVRVPGGSPRGNGSSRSPGETEPGKPLSVLGGPSHGELSS